IDEVKQSADQGWNLLKNGNTSAGTALLDSITSKLAKVWTESEDVLSLVRRIEAENPAMQTRTRQSLQSWIWVGVLINLSLAIGLAIIFQGGMTRRLSNLMQNVERLSDGRPLSPPLDGSDEVALLDKKFHEAIIERKKLEQELRDTEAKLTAILSSM